MLKEIEDVRQIPEDGPRRWFADKNIDLIVWYLPDKETITGFQLCYDKQSVQRCLTWQKSSGNVSSTLSADGRFSMKRVIRLFEAACSELPEKERTVILECLTKREGS
jgi:hypothetical protein